MKYLATGKQMKAVDRYTIETVGIPSLVLMERAALWVAEEAGRLAGERGRVLCVCGVGNNGADAVAAGRMLALTGRRVELLIVGNPERATEEMKRQLSIAAGVGLTASCFEDRAREMFQDRAGYDVVVDGLFGVGLTRDVGGIYAEAVECINSLEAAVVAVDVPSGIDADTGAVMGVAVQADVTITFGLNKIGIALFPGREYAGRVLVRDIGFPAQAYEAAGCRAFTYGPEDFSRLPVRPAGSNKGTFGKVLIVAGSAGMAGAAYLSGLAAYRMGVGLVRLLTVEENRQILQTLLPEAIMTVYDPCALEEGRAEAMTKLEEACNWASVVVLGPGLGRNSYVAALVEQVMANVCGPLIMDADALNAVADLPYLTRYYTDNVVITPHLGEMSRLTGLEIPELKRDLAGAALGYAKTHGITCILKDAATAAAGPGGELYINSSGNSGMSTGGSGDVLTGVLAGLLAGGMEIWDASALGVYLHGAAGDRAKERLGERAMLARDIIEGLGEWK